MRTRRAVRGLAAAVAVGYLALCWSGTTHAQVKLEFKFPEGKKLTYKTTSKKRQVLTLMGSQIASEENRTTISSLTVGKRRNDSTLPVERKTESLRVDLSLPGDIKLAYDSSNPDTKINNPDFAFLVDECKLDSEVVYTVVLNDKNKVKAIEGTEKLQEKADKLDPTSRELLRTQFNSDKLKRSFEQELDVVPDVLARPGEPWERTETLEISGGMTFSFRKKYEYADTVKKGDKTLDKINGKLIEVTCKQDPDANPPLKVVKSSLKVDSSDGTILFDREEGHVVESKGRMRIRGDVTFSANATNVAGAIDLRIATDIELQPAVK